MRNIKRWLWCRWFHKWRQNHFYGGWYRNTCCTCDNWERMENAPNGIHGRRCRCDPAGYPRL